MTKGKAQPTRRQNTKPTQAIRTRRPKQVRRKIQKPPARNPMNMSLAAFDPRTMAHLPGPRATAPYVVARERVNVPLFTNNAGQHTVCLIGAFVQSTFGSSGGEHLSSTVAISGVGGDVPGTTETPYGSVLFTGTTSMSKTMVLHSVQIEVICTGTSTGVIPQGLAWIGALPQPLNRSSWDYWNDIANKLKTRQGMKQFSAYELMARPQNFMSYPLDGMRHSEFLWQAGHGQTSDELHRGLAPLVVCLGPTSNVVDYSITAILEWKVREAMDPILQSTHKHHNPTSESVWSQLGHKLSNVGGFMGAVQGVEDGIKAISGAINLGMRTAPRALALLG